MSYDEDMYVRCSHCKKSVHLDKVWFDGLGGRFCIDSCKHRGSKKLTDFYEEDTRR